MNRQNYLAKLERAIAEKYGEETVEHPRRFWNEQMEEEYVRQSDELYEKILSHKEKYEKKEKNGYLIADRLINSTTKRSCPVCKELSFNMVDDYYMYKYECCHKCYIEFVEDRQERWESGWRPNKKEKNYG